MKENWKTIDDNKIRHVWVSEYGEESAVVSPDWYEENGTPIDESGEDMVYSHTEILTD